MGVPEACTSMPASRASPVVVVLNLIVAKETDLIAALTRPEVLVGHVHVLHTQGAACHDSVGLKSDFMSVTAMDSLASPCRSGSGDARVVPLWARAHGETHNHHRPSRSWSRRTSTVPTGAFLVLSQQPSFDNSFSKIWVFIPREKISANLAPSPAFREQPKVPANFAIFIAHWPPQPTVPHGFCLRFSCAT